MIKIKGFVTSLLLLHNIMGISNEGFWLPILLDEIHKQELAGLGLNIPFEEVFHNRQPSLKDAVVQINQNCTGSVISPSGLVLTNYHCLKNRLDQIDHPSPTQWALNKKQEIPIKGLTVTFIVSIKEVTQEVLNNIREDLPERVRQFRIRQYMNQVQRQAKRNPSQGIIVKSFFEDTRFFLFTTETYYDVRLVGFSDPAASPKNHDNYWLPNKEDFALIRVYANSENQPAIYSTSNTPYRPKKHLILSKQAHKKEDFSMTLGFPAYSQLFLPAQSLESRFQRIEMLKIELQQVRLKGFKNSQRKEWIKRLQKELKKQKEKLNALNKTNGINQRYAKERVFRKRMSRNPILKKKYASLLSNLEKITNTWLPSAIAHTYSTEITQRNISLLQLANQLERIKKTHQQFGNKRLEFRQKQVIHFLENFSSRFEPQIDQKLFASYMQLYYSKIPPEYFTNYIIEQYDNARKDCAKLARITYTKSILSRPDQLIHLAQISLDTLFAKLKKDYGMRFASALRTIHEQQIEPNYEQYDHQFRVLYRKYLMAMKEAFPEENYYPDANNTLRLGYGRIKQKLEGGWLTDIHTTSGNSGSPLLNAQGELIGLITSRPPEAKASDWYFHRESFSSYAIDIKYIIDKIEAFTEVGFIKKALSE